jgi:transglutaminase-like putative cysteine protease
MRERLTVLFFLAVACCAAAQTQPKAPADNAQEAAVIEQMITRAHFENDGTGSIEHSRVVRIQSEAGIELFGQLVFGYSSATEKLKVDYVRVRKPGGQVIETPESNAQDFAPEVLQSVPMYSDFRERHVTVAGLRPGDVLELKTTRQITTALAPGEFWFEYSFPEHIAANQVRLEIDVPKARDVKIKSPKRKYSTAETGDRRTYTWVVEKIAPDRKDRDEDADDDDEDNDFPDVQLTTFKDWPAVAHWYAKLQGERVVVDEAMKRKAAELTQGATTTDEKARRIYDFVARDIRYVSLSFGVGRYQPHASTEVLAGSYGDCKDKHTLLAALLRAAGIPSYPVLIGSERKLDEDIPSPAQFDHVITLAQIDKDQVWLDSTAEVAPYGLLLYPLRDKQAVLAADDASGGLRRTPASVPVKNTLSLTLSGKVSESGALDATVDITAGGDSAVPMRMAFRSTSQADWQKLGERIAYLQGYRGKVSDVEATEIEAPAKPMHIRYKLHEDTFFSVPSTDVAWYVFPPLGVLRLPRKKAGKPLDIGPALEMHNKAHLEFAGNYSVKVPPEVAIARDYGQYSLSYTLANNVLEGDQTYILKVNQLPAARRPDVESLRSVAVDYVRESVTFDVRPASKAGTAGRGRGRRQSAGAAQSRPQGLEPARFQKRLRPAEESRGPEAGQRGCVGRTGPGLHRPGQSSRRHRRLPQAGRGQSLQQAGLQRPWRRAAPSRQI